jgi:acyl-CoA reductase-like NAD-dependent aldehyde dehydrogenase
MIAWKILALAFKVQRGWRRIPPAQRRQLLENAGKHARRHGPVLARHVSAALKNSRLGR